MYTRTDIMRMLEENNLSALLNVQKDNAKVLAGLVMEQDCLWQYVAAFGC